MPTCEHCRELLLDYVYALLEESEHQDVRAHLAGCASCQTALAAAQAEQTLLARAARAISNVPELTLPTSQPAEVSPTAPTIPVILPNAPKRSQRRRSWIAWSSVAVVLVALGASVAGYRHELNARQHVRAEAEAQLKTVDQQLAAYPAKVEAEMAAALQAVRAQTGPYLHVIGPTTIQPHGKAPIHITTRGLDADLLAGTLRLKLVEPETDNVLFLARLDSDGQARGDIDASNAKPNTTLNLIVEVETPFGVARLQEPVRVAAPSYVTRLDTNKSIYQVKDVIFFRALVLDRYSLTPPGLPIPMRAELRNPAGQAVAFVELPTGAGGILAGELPIPEQFPAGPYTLHVAALKAPEVQPCTQGIEVVRDVPAIRLDQPRYAKGDVIKGDVTLPPGLAGEAKAKGTIGNNSAVDVTLRARPEAAAAPAFGGAGAGKRAKSGQEKQAAQPAEGQVFQFQMILPDNLPQGANEVPLTLEFKDGLRREVLVPLEPTEFAIDFFPEGGDLVEGVKNRVFYRVRSKSGAPVSGEGRVILLTGKNDIVDTHYKLGLGFLDFTPDSKETYTVRITTPTKVAEVLNPFARPGIRKDGIVLHVPRAVGKEGDPIRLVLRQKAPGRKLLLLAHCRGQVVEERTVELKAGHTDVTLQPGGDVHGMIRVTAYEIAGAQLQPLAERLVYRAPAQRLDLSFALGAPQLQPGLHLKAKLRASDEKGQPAPAWVLASIVDERFQPRLPSLSAHFLLLNEIRTGADIDNARLILNDSAESRQMLERFLGTHGWRRFVSDQEAPLVAVGKADADRPSLLFSRENAALAALQAKYQAQRTAALRPVHKLALQKELDLRAERDKFATAAVAARSAVFEFEGTTQLAMRIGLGLATLGLLLASLVLMAIGLYRLARANKVATGAFGGAFAGLAACLAILVLGTTLGPLEIRTPNENQAAAVGQVNRVLEKFLAPAPARPFVHDGPIGNGYLAAMPVKIAERDSAKAALGNGMAAKDGVGGAGPGRGGAPSEQKTDAVARRIAPEGAPLPFNRQSSMAARFEQARSTTTFPPVAALGGAVSEKLKFSAAPPGATRKKDEDRAVPTVEYFHRYVPNVPADTLLWHPNLWLELGQAEAHFDIASGQATYRVLLLAHGPAGRFGYYETRLDVADVEGK